MYIFYKELSLEEGFDIAELERNSRIVAGREVSTAGGIALFKSLYYNHEDIKCWQCGCVADRWISERHLNETERPNPPRPVLNLYATRWERRRRSKRRGDFYMAPILVLMTRDHIIPRSLGGVDDIVNLRPGCEICNGNRSSHMNEEDTAFMLAHPELINAERLKEAEKAKRRNEKELERQRAAKAIKESQGVQTESESGGELLVRAAPDCSNADSVDLFLQSPERLFGEGWRDLLVHPVEAPGLPRSEVVEATVKPTKRELGNKIVGFSPAQVAIWATWIGKPVWKKTGKPFKSGSKVNTVKGICKHDQTDHFAFTFEEDESKVECFRVQLFVYEEPMS